MLKGLIKITSKKILLVIILILFFVGFIHTHKPLPYGISIESNAVLIPENDIKLLYDTTFLDASKKRISEQEIFDQVKKMIQQAQDFILIDIFLFGSAKDAHRHIALELMQNLVEKKTTNPNIVINLVTDKYNTMYMPSDTVSEFKRLKEVGVNIIFTDMDILRDSNPLYSSVWRAFLQWFGESKNGWIKNPISESPTKVSIRGLLKMLNFKANHRKIVLADDNGKIVSFISSANPHDPSSAHSNVAIFFMGESWEDIYQGEKSIAEFSQTTFKEIPTKYFKKNNMINTEKNTLLIQYLTESKIKKAIIEETNKAVAKDQIRIAMFYLSDRDIVASLLHAQKRGSDVELILDPNKDAFGIKKNGIPNRQVALELVEKSKSKIRVRWYDTHGEQFHTKFFLINKKNKESALILGSANFTRRNLDDLNLEADIKISGKTKSKIFKETNEIFEALWENKNGNTYTVDFEKYKDTSILKTYIYRFQEWSGLSTF